ncbi:InlB B-repeat-containing protein [Rhodoluna limnophila]|uniref:InlB B-repeat-containing protein n=1 Tax=Rhodoluna limnophila TaxID=232537 RepID=UPI001105F156|nr:InlB B-repeat-containing protein [Rhodoluna limnophila]
MFKIRPVKAFISGLLSLGLAFGFATAMQVPATAVSQGCVSSNFQPRNCASELTYTAIADISAVTGSVVSTSQAISCTPTSVTLNTVSADDGLLPVTGSVAGLSFTYASATATLGGTTSGTVPSTRYVILAMCNDNTQQAFDFNVYVYANTTYTVSFEKTVNSIGSSATGTFTAITQASAGASVSLPTDPALAGYTFGGWSATSGGTTAVSNTYTPTADATLYAIWTAVVDNTGTTPEPDRKVTICHRTHSVTNPYVRITVDYNSVNRPSGHQGHDEIFAGEHVFKAGIYKRAKDKDWGDIIPTDPTGLNRWQPLNWSALGEQIYNGTVAGCPTYDPTTYYNALREAGVPEGKIKAEIAQLEAEQSEANPGRTETDETTLRYTGSSTKLAAEETDKVTICHATNATTNPYRRITVSASSITNKAGHYGHDDIYLTNHVFNSEVDYPANQKDWGDIIPADPTGQNRWQPLNWTALGQKIYNGTVAGCGEQTTQEFYNEMREAGLPKKEVVKDLKTQKSVDDDLKELDEIEYTGTDPQTERTEPKEPTVPTDKNIIDQSLSGIVWLDLNRDGLKDPDEPFMPNITLSVVQVTSVNPAAVNYRTAGAVRPAAVVTVKTDANGFYIFPSLGAGDWKVVTGVPADLGVTYDSEGGPEGEVTTTVPVGSSAFTWVGLVGDSTVINEKLLEEILLEYPSSLPIEELPTWLQVKVTAKLAELEAAENGETLAYTGSEDLAWLFFGVLIMLSGMLALVAKRR